MLLVGSSAIKHHFKDFKREPKDIDYLVLKNESSTKEVEYLLNPILGGQNGIADPNTLYTLKFSHVIGWDLSWEKHMFDIQFLKSKGCKLDRNLFDNLYKYWNEFHGKNNRSDLDQTADSFFNNALSTPHDYYHTILKEVPTYTKVLKDGAEVDVCQDKFNNLSFEEKCDLVREEVMVMAYERYNKSLSYVSAYSKMLKKFIINHAPLWEAIFIVENYIPLHRPKFNYFEKISEHLERIK